MIGLKSRYAQENDKQLYCKLHTQRIIQLAACLTCQTPAPICQAKGCIKHHTQSEKLHNTMTLDFIRQMVKQLIQSEQIKKSNLKILVQEYFRAAFKAMQVLEQDIYVGIDRWKLDDIMLNKQEQNIIDKLIAEDYNGLTCSEMGIIIPKINKHINFNDGHFEHLKQYLKNEKQKIQSVLDGIILNLPYFRDQSLKNKQKQFLQIQCENLRDLNQSMRKIQLRPKKLRLKYKTDEDDEQQRKQFIRNLCTTDKITTVEQLEIYCEWDVHEEDFQIAFFQAMAKYPFLRNVTIFTGNKVTQTSFAYEVMSEMTAIVRIYKKRW